MRTVYEILAAYREFRDRHPEEREAGRNRRDVTDFP